MAYLVIYTIFWCQILCKYWKVLFLDFFIPNVFPTLVTLQNYLNGQCLCFLLSISTFSIIYPCDVRSTWTLKGCSFLRVLQGVLQVWILWMFHINPYISNMSNLKTKSDFYCINISNTLIISSHQCHQCHY